MTIYDFKPSRLLDQLHDEASSNPRGLSYCAGFEFGKWRCGSFANHLIEWLPDYALLEEELRVHHGNAYVKLQQAAVRVYTSAQYARRGEAGEIALHAVCRDFFDTIPISPRVFYKSSSNDPIKSFDMVHARFPSSDTFEIWLGESKLYADGDQAISAAITSVASHIDQGFLTNEKLLLGPQISKNTPHYEQILRVFRTQTSLDEFLKASVFVIGILCDSEGLKKATSKCDSYVVDAVSELNRLVAKVAASPLATQLRIVVVYIPLDNKDALASAFDDRLKGLQWR
ncbi:DUF1837 domain-containing protein [Hyphomicrobium sp.]|uniref:HamA C-terminal domain-containing protein n=1 Tax=Hyphomicrobium sp. TaxID=82 RepID=UPI002E326B3C|nr:DUF1837 domain-containing protein [Hyphomicrobium sp.]HEX2843484.1 DUF1837 domain-containing protein [Hyphomicrobium sp.]